MTNKPKKGRPPELSARRNKLTIRLDDAAWQRLIVLAQNSSPRTVAASIISDALRQDVPND